MGVDGSSPEALLFTAPSGMPLHYSAWRRRIWLPAIAASGLGTLDRRKVKGKGPRDRYVGPGFHDLRRTSSAALVAAGVDIKTAQVRLGHSDPRHLRAGRSRVGSRRR